MHYLDSLAAQKESQRTFSGFDDVNNMDSFEVLDDCDVLDQGPQFDDFNFEIPDYFESIDALTTGL